MKKISIEELDTGEPMMASAIDEKLIKLYERKDAFCSSDYHLGRQFLYLPSDKKYKEAVENTERCIELHNKIVGKDDSFLFLGDLTESEFGEQNDKSIILKDVKKFVDRLNGNILMVAGNNDTLDPKFYEECGITVLRCMSVTGNKFKFSHYPFNVTDGKLNIHGHIHGNKKYWAVNPKNHIDVYWKLWDGPKTISEFEEIYKSGKYKGLYIPFGYEGQPTDVHGWLFNNLFWSPFRTPVLFTK